MNLCLIGCKSLTAAPELPATTLANACYNNMFKGCSSLTAAPELPATTLADACYSNMFDGCSSLTNAPELPATTLASSCYSYMFKGCSSLTAAPELPATTLANNCYFNMFYGCTSLNSVSVKFKYWNPRNATTYWLTSVAAEGIFIAPETLPDTPGSSNIPVNWAKVTDKTSKYIQITTTRIEFSSDLGYTKSVNIGYHTNDGEINFEVENLPEGIFFSTPNQIYSTGEFTDEGEYSVKIIATGETQRVETYITIIKKRNRIIIDDKEIKFYSRQAAKTVPIDVSFSDHSVNYILTVDESNLPRGISYSNNSFISDPESIVDTITREIQITVESSTGYSQGDTAIYTIKVSTEDPLNERSDILCVNERARRRNRYDYGRCRKSNY